MRVYNLIYFNRSSNSIPISKLVVAPTFEDAKDEGDRQVSTLVGNLDGWGVVRSDYVEIPDKQEERGTESYLHGLMLARDMFTKGKEEKITLNRIIKRIGKKYEKRHQ